MSSNCGYASSCPEPVNVNIAQTVIQIGNSPAMHRVQDFSYSESSDNKTFGLQYFPYEPRSVQVSRNSGDQRYGYDYTVQGQFLVLLNPLLLGEQIQVRYLSVDGTVSSQTSTVGMLVSSAGTTLEGFLRMDGETSHNWAENLPLRDWFWQGASGAGIGEPSDTQEPGKERRDKLLQSVTSTTFTLVLLQDTVYDGTSLKTLNKYISRGAAAVL